MKLIALTPGEPAGIGPDLIISIAQQTILNNIIVIADKYLLQQRATLLNYPLEIIDYDPAINFQLQKKGQLTVLHQPLIVDCVPGQLNKNNSEYVLATLQRAARGCLNKEFAAIVTGPVHKGIINDAGIKFSGHTEFFAEISNTEHVVMLLAAKQLRVALVTTHLPLRYVADAITENLLVKTLTILHHDLKKHFRIQQPRILVCGLNPHAGENGHSGREEIEIITPTLEKLRQQGMQLIGPVSADTAFLPKNLIEIDVVLAMYHDQGLTVLKHIAFDNAVNITLGLPFIRTSVDHGTALHLAGTGQADANSLLAAIEMANRILF